MRIHISASDGVPIYLQIVQQVRRLIAAGELVDGEELPSIRGLAEQLLVNPNTIARAYRELEVGGFVSSSRGLGTYVTAKPEGRASEPHALLADKVDDLLIESRSLSVSLDELIELIRVRGAMSDLARVKEVSRG